MCHLTGTRGSIGRTRHTERHTIEPDATRPQTGGPARLVFLNQHYAPDLAATAVLLTDAARYLAARGYEVRVVCAANRYERGRVDAPARETVEGVRVRRFWAPGLGRGRLLGRMLDYLFFIVQAAVYLLRAPADVVVSLTTPPLLPVVGDWLAHLRGARHVIWSMDLHPDAEIAAGLLRRRGLMARILSRAQSRAYRRADLTMALGRLMQQRIVGMGVPVERVPVIPPWADGNRLQPVDRSRNPLASRLGIDGDCFVIMYSGNAGLAHDFDALIRAAADIRSPEVLFLFAGAGPRRPEIMAAADELGVTNLRYVDYFPDEDLARSLSLADVHVVTLRDSFAGVSVPAKLYGIMAVGRPVMFIGPQQSETAMTIREADCGVVIDPQCVPDARAAIADRLDRWRFDRTGRELCGRRGRVFFERRHERIVGCHAFETRLSERLSPVVGPPRGR